MEFHLEEVEGSIPARFERIARTIPDAQAIVDDGVVVTYRETDRAANAIARDIVEHIGADVSTPDAPITVGVLMGLSAQCIVALLGVLKAGKTYVALDPGFPIARLRYVAEDAQVQLLLTNDEHMALARQIGGDRPVLNLDRVKAQDPVSESDQGMASTALAAVLYTSGSTGEPKGVPRLHGALLHRAYWVNQRLGIGPNDRLPALSNVMFGRTAADIFDALLTGACVCPYDLKVHGVNTLWPWLDFAKITILHLSLATFRSLGDVPEKTLVAPSIRQVIIGGAALLDRDLEMFRAKFAPGCGLQYRYSSTETGPICWYDVPADRSQGDPRLPVGDPFPGIHLRLVDEFGRQVGDGDIGEFDVSGRYIAPGFWRKPELTLAKFELASNGKGDHTYHTGDLGRMRPDGMYEMIGRKDMGVKVRGYLVDPSEIENALLASPAVVSAVVAPFDTRPESDGRLAAYIVPAAGASLKADDVRGHLLARLPDYMLPEAIVFMDSLPLTPNGKVDRRALPPPTRARATDVDFVAPRTDYERQLCRIWSDVLAIDRVGVHDSFLNLGGNSLLAARIISRVLRTFQVNLSLKALYDAPTVAEMAAAVAEHQTQMLDPAELDRVLAHLEAGHAAAP